jgi:hypothetical protein
MTNAQSNARSLRWLVFAAMLVVCAGIYAPGLWGSFVLDDSTFIIANVAMHVNTLHFADWFAAALSFPSGSHQGRWLGMLSFAVNHYFTGLDPFWLKLTNVGIHLLNGMLVFLMLRALFALWRECQRELADRHRFDPELAATAVAGLWLVLPINVTAVLYVSQRLESLSNTFVFLGLWWYLRARLAQWRGERGPAGLWLSLIVSTGIGVLVKESAVTLPLYALCVEFAITGLRTRDGRWSRPVLILYAALIGLPLVAGAMWLASWIGGVSSYARPFDTIERLMTEARVLVDYIRWTLLPQPESLTLYHDDIAVSHGILDPPSTLAAIGGLLALLGVAIWQRTRRPLFSLGVLWFFGGHLLTGTVIPLMLAFEHRNYFPSIGLLLAGASLIALEGGLQRTRIRAMLVGCVFVFYAFTTWMRAEEWSAPLRFALSEANKRPDSSAAQYELARMLLYSHHKDDPTLMTTQAFEVLERASLIPNADIMHEQLLIVGHAQLLQPIKPAWWDSLINKLRKRPPTSSDITALGELLQCHESRVCAGDTDNLRLALEAAVSWPSPDRSLLTYYGEFLSKIIDDQALAEKQLRTAVALAPGDATTHANLFTILVHAGKLDEAVAELDALRRLNHFGSLDATIGKMERTLWEAQTARANPANECAGHAECGRR